MRSLKTLPLLALLGGALLFLRLAQPAPAAAAANEAAAGSGYRVLAPITHGSLTIFPVVAASSHDTKEFLTLDEGLRSGEVVVTEAGRVTPLMRRRPTTQNQYPGRGDGAEVNRLVLVNNSKRPLLLLAGEIVTGGKQDRVIGKDRIIPAESDPIDLSVFCVEQGRWTARTEKFGGLSAQMAQPSVRKEAMANKDQQKVWTAVGTSNRKAAEVAATAPASAGGGVGAGRELSVNSSYAANWDHKAVKDEVDKVAAPLQKSYESVMRRLKDQNAVGVVVAINGEIEWADIFASTDLLQKYWPKLVRSYAAESIGVGPAKFATPTQAQAQQFLNDWSGKRQMVETEPGLFRHVEVAGRGFRAFQLTSLLPKTGFDLHLSKMAEEGGGMIGN